MKILFLFPGQGSQYVGMGKFLLDDPIGKKTFDEADQALGDTLSGLIFNGPEEKLRETDQAQPAILTVSVAVGRILQSKGITPLIMAGHSLGEYSALVMSEAMKFQDAVKIVRLRGKYMQEAVPLGTGTMSAVLGAEDSLVEEVCKTVSKEGAIVEPANYNCPGQLVISGTNEGVARAVQMLGERGVKKCIPLKVSAPFHCSLLKPAAEKLKKDLEKIHFTNPRFHYVANVDSTLVTKKEEILSRLVNQVFRPVRWAQSLQKIVSDFKPSQMIEVGPGQVVSGHMKKIDSTLPRFFTDNIEGFNNALATSQR